MTLDAEFPELRGVVAAFSDRGTVVPGDRRPIWRLALVALVLFVSSRGAKSSIWRLHILDWAARTAAGRDELLAYTQGRLASPYLGVRYDPALQRIIVLGDAEGVLSVSGRTVSLTERGKRFATALLDEPTVLAEETAFLQKLGKAFLERSAEDVASGRART